MPSRLRNCVAQPLIRWLIPANLGSAARERLHDDHLVDVVEAHRQVASAFPAYEDAHVLAELVLFVDDAEAHPWVATVEVEEHGGEGVAVGEDVGLLPGVRPQRRGHAYLHERSCPTWLRRHR